MGAKDSASQRLVCGWMSSLRVGTDVGYRSWIVSSERRWVITIDETNWSLDAAWWQGVVDAMTRRARPVFVATTLGTVLLALVASGALAAIQHDSDPDVIVVAPDSVAEGAPIEVEIIARDAQALAGFELLLEFDTSAAEFAGVETLGSGIAAARRRHRPTWPSRNAQRCCHRGLQLFICWLRCDAGRAKAHRLRVQ